MAKIVPFPGAPQFSPLTSCRFKARCLNCGNEEVFLIRAYTFPIAVIKKESEGRFAIEDVFYDQNGTVSEQLISCAKCGCPQLSFRFLDEG